MSYRKFVREKGRRCGFFLSPPVDEILLIIPSNLQVRDGTVRVLLFGLTVRVGYGVGELACNSYM